MLGPCFFYVGVSDSLAVEPREVVSATSEEPELAADTALLDSGCEIQGSRLFCHVLRSLDGSADANQNPDFGSTQCVRARVRASVGVRMCPFGWEGGYQE